MHILFVTAEYPPMPGGLGAYTAALGQALQAQGCQISILTGAAVDTPDTASSLPVYAAIQRWDWRIGRQIAHWARQLQADWVHIQYQTGAYAMHPAINFAPTGWRAEPLRVAWTYHDLLVPYLFPKAGAWLRRWVTTWPARRADLVIVTNEADRLTLEQRGIAASSIPIGSNIQGQPTDDAGRQAARRAYGYGPQPYVIGYFGLLNRSKGARTLVQTVAQLVAAEVDAHLLMIGETVGVNDPTNQAYLHEVEILIHELGLGERVRWTGPLSEADVSGALHACDVLLMPYEDGASLRRGTLMAGLAHGCAIITTTPQGPLPELVAGRDLLTIPPRDVAAAVAANQQLRANPALADNLRVAAYRASQQFTWAQIAQRHLEAYGEV